MGSVNFGRWLERLGFKDGREPAIIRAVQPVQVVQDVSLLVSPLLPPSGFAGGDRTGLVAVFSAFEVQGGTRGGALIEVEVSDSGSTAVIGVVRLTAPATMADLIVVNVVEFQPGRTIGFRLGSLAASLIGTGDPQIRASPNGGGVFRAYIPPGTWMLFENATAANRRLQVNCTYQEFEAATKDE